MISFYSDAREKKESVEKKQSKKGESKAGKGTTKWKKKK